MMTTMYLFHALDAIIKKYPQNVNASLYNDPRIVTEYINILPKICVKLDGIDDNLDEISIVRIPSLNNNNMSYEEFKDFINPLGAEIVEEELFTLKLKRVPISELNNEKNRIFKILWDELDKIEMGMGMGTEQN